QAHAEAHPEEATRVRMGLHTGEAVKEGDDFFGTHVALAARIAAAARGGEILVSSLLKDLTDGSGDLEFGPGRDADLKGFSAVRLHAAQPQLRVGLHTGGLPSGDATGDGTALPVARDLGRRAQPGQVLCSGVVARLLAGRPRLAFAPVDGGQEDAGEVTAVYELRAEAAGGEFAAPAELIGRQAESVRLVERLADAAAGRGGLVMLAG